MSYEDHLRMTGKKEEKKTQSKPNVKPTKQSNDNFGGLLCTAALLPELQPAPCFLSSIIGQID